MQLVHGETPADKETPLRVLVSADGVLERDGPVSTPPPEAEK